MVISPINVEIYATNAPNVKETGGVVNKIRTAGDHLYEPRGGDHSVSKSKNSVTFSTCIPLNVQSTESVTGDKYRQT